MADTTDVARITAKGADLRGADLCGADLRGVKLLKPNLRGANLSGANLSEADLSDADLRGARLDAATLLRVRLNRAYLCDATLSKANLSQAELLGADLRKAQLIGANLIAANLFKSDLSDADLSGADLKRAKLSEVRLSEATLSKANLNEANLMGADLSKAQLIEANLSRARLDKSNLSDADLSGAQLTGVNLSEANLLRADFSGGDLSRAELVNTILCDTMLARTKGLETCRHRGPSFIDFRTLIRSGNLPLLFLRGCGLPDRVIDSLPPLVDQAIQFYSCFISYSIADKDFAERLYADLQNRGVRCWFAPHNMQAGKKVYEQIDEAIQVNDRLLLILSEHSMDSEWVKTEISKARKREAREKRQMLFPLSLVGFDKLRDWECFDADRGSDSAKVIREYLIPDFSRWQDHDSYQKELERVVKGLKFEDPR